VKLLRTTDPDFEAGFTAFLDAPRGAPADVDAAVAEILEGVRTRGLEALLDYCRRFDRVELTADTLRVTADEIAAALGCSMSYVSRLKQRHKLPNRQKGIREIDEPDPTPKQIAERAAECRARRVVATPKEERVSVPRYSWDGYKFNTIG
jgi:histidinol dehydrogenase